LLGAAIIYSSFAVMLPDPFSMNIGVVKLHRTPVVGPRLNVILALIQVGRQIAEQLPEGPPDPCNLHLLFRLSCIRTIEDALSSYLIQIT